MTRRPQKLGTPGSRPDDTQLPERRPAPRLASPIRRGDGFVPDDKLPGYDPRTDFLAFIFAQGKRFEDAVMGLIEERFTITPHR